MLACALMVVLRAKAVRPPRSAPERALLATSPFFVKWSQQARGTRSPGDEPRSRRSSSLRALERGSRAPGRCTGSRSRRLRLAPRAVPPARPGRTLSSPAAPGALPAPRLLAASIVLAVGVPWVAQLALRSRGETRVIVVAPSSDARGASRGALLEVSGAARPRARPCARSGLWVLWRARERDCAGWLGVWAFSPFVLALVISLARPIFLDRYLIVAAPAFALLAASP